MSFEGTLVLVVAIINYTNLTTARHTQRVKEVGVRKILGAGRGQLIKQFLAESFLVTISAFVIAILLAELTRPFLTTISGSEHFKETFLNPSVLLASAGLAIIIGIATGVVPALVLSAFKPVQLFKANLGTFARGATLRKSLVISQFTVSIALTICTIIVYKQLTYMQTARLGYDKEHTLVLNIGFAEVRKQYQTLKDILSEHSSITGAAAVSQLPTDIQTGENIDISANQSEGVYCVSVDPDFFDVMDVSITSGEQLIHSIIPNDSMNLFRAE